MTPPLTIEGPLAHSPLMREISLNAMNRRLPIFTLLMVLSRIQRCVVAWLVPVARLNSLTLTAAGGVLAIVG